VRLLARTYKHSAASTGTGTNTGTDTSTTAVMLQVELAGLGKFGQSIDKFLEKGIYGYHPD
jgi:LPS-assembly protein